MSWTSERARLASLSRSRQPDDPDLLNARRDLKAARLEDYVRDAVASAPPLTPAQRDHIASLLHSGAVRPARELRRSSGAVDHLIDLEG